MARGTATKNRKPKPEKKTHETTDAVGKHDKMDATAVDASPAATAVPRKRQREHADADVLLGSFIVSDLPTNMAAIYTRAVRRMLPQEQKYISEADIIEEVDGATLTFEVPNKEIAASMLKRLQNLNMYGRRWKVECYPLHVLQCAKEACLVDISLIPPGPRTLALRALGGIQGFLTLVDSENFSASVDAASSAMEYGGGDVVEHAVASFVDEGSALHARAVLSGRLIGTSGVRMFLERRFR